MLNGRELELAAAVLREGRGLVLVLNKADTLSPQQRRAVVQVILM